MFIAFYAPFKPLDHPNPSGDVVIGAGLYRFLEERGHRLETASTFRTRWIFWKPWRLPTYLRERRRVARRLTRRKPDLWLTYHAYFKGPDILGPGLTAAAAIPYVIFQGAYATKRRRDPRTWPGFALNRRALKAARHVFANKRVDDHNLRRLLPPQRVSYVPPGIVPGEFAFDDRARADWRTQWRVGDAPVIVSAAMFRPGVKTTGLIRVLRTCGALREQGLNFHLAIAGDGKEKRTLVRLADDLLPGRVHFLGKLPRSAMYRFYSAGDLFVFPGIGESLGMVYLEAQSCGLPVVAFANAGVPEVVQDGSSGCLVPLEDHRAFAEAVRQLLLDPDRRKAMGLAAGVYVRERHDTRRNYRAVERRLLEIAAGAG
jgi:glycosyltransferase involved in cell wall biosynthesis